MNGIFNFFSQQEVISLSCKFGRICFYFCFLFRKPLKHTLFNGKTVWVYSNVENKGDDRVISFVEIWSSIIKNLGANLVECPSSETLKKFDFISSGMC